MDWYYVDNGRRIGPVDDTTLQVLVNAGAVGPGTLVWREGMSGWQPYAAARPEGAGAPGAAAAALPYAGFWIRVVAKLVDSAILWAAGVALALAFAPVTGGFRAALASPFAENEHPLLLLAQIAGAAAYSTLFVGRYGATPGKMAAGLKIVTPDGGKVGYGTALCRYFAEILSSVILGIGYLMIAFDAQKRGLHDRICRTRVVFR
ncbi:MAG: RDD family protein [Gemmatimonadota bacterium]